MGLVSLFTDFSSEMVNPLPPIFVAGLAAVLMVVQRTTRATRES
jgi:hypothetical protein